MASRLFARRKQQTKKATTLVSSQSLEQAIQEANALVDQLMESDAHDSRLDQLEKAISFLTSILKKSPMDMQQEGASSLEDYLDDAVLPEVAQKIKQDVDMIANMKNAGNQSAAPVMASGSDNWVSDRGEDGKAKAELLEVPRLAADKKKAAPAAPVSPATPAQPSADIKQLNSDTLAKIQKALAGTDDLMNDKAAQAFIAAIAQELMNRPVEVEEEKPAAGAPGAAPMPMAASLIGGLKLAFFDEDEEEMDGISCPTCGGEAIPLGGLGNLMHFRCRQCGAEFSEKIASKQASQGGSFVNDGETGSIVEDGGRTPEIGKAHKELEDNTGIKRPATELVTKFAGDMTATKAVKMTETLSTQLKTLYLDAKKVTEVLDTRPVREAVESIFRAYDLMGEATKVLNKQKMQEEAEEQAIEVKEKNKKSSSLLFGLAVAADEDGEEFGEKEAGDELVHGLARYPEFNGVVREVTRSTINIINEKAPLIKSEMPYKAQFVLEEVIKKLQDAV